MSNVSATDDVHHNTSTESSKRSLRQTSNNFLHRIQSNTNWGIRNSFIGPKSFHVNVQLLDDFESVQGDFKKTNTGRDVLDFVCKELNIVEKEYFGLRYIDKHRYWVDLNAPLSKMFSSQNVAFSFRFRFYPNDLSSIKEEVTRYQLFVQLQRDLLHGRLQCKQADSAGLAALILQAEQGDYDEERHFPGYVSEFKLLLRQSERVEEKIAELHKSLRGTTSDAAIDDFLKRCFALQTYGINPYSVTIGSTNVVIGASSNRVLIFVLNQVVYNIPWNYLSDIDYSGKHLKLKFKKEYFSDYLVANPHLSPDAALSKVVGSTLFANDLKPDKNDKKLQLKFTCPNSTFAKHLWRDLLGQQVFFSENAACDVKPRFSKPKIPLLTRGSTFRCPVSRVMSEIQKDTTPPREIKQHEFLRYSLPRQKSRLSESFQTNKTASIEIPAIKIRKASVHADHELSESSSPAPPQASEPEIEQPIVSSENFNQIHVDSKIDLKPDVQEEKPVEVLQNGNLMQQAPTPPTVVTKLPISDANKNGVVMNGTLTNGFLTKKDQKLVKSVQKPRFSRQIFAGILDLFIMLLLFTVPMIILFETVGHDEPNWFKPHISSFKAYYYEPWRVYVVNSYRQFFH